MSRRSRYESAPESVTATAVEETDAADAAATITTKRRPSPERYTPKPGEWYGLDYMGRAKPAAKKP